MENESIDHIKCANGDSHLRVEYSCGQTLGDTKINMQISPRSPLATATALAAWMRSITRASRDRMLCDDADRARHHGACTLLVLLVDTWAVHSVCVLNNLIFQFIRLRRVFRWCFNSRHLVFALSSHHGKLCLDGDVLAIVRLPKQHNLRLAAVTSHRVCAPPFRVPAPRTSDCSRVQLRRALRQQMQSRWHNLDGRLDHSTVLGAQRLGQHFIVGSNCRGTPLARPPESR